MCFLAGVLPSALLFKHFSYLVELNPDAFPKALIHRNVPGEPIHAFFLDLTREWERAAPLSTFSPAQRWKASLQAMHDAGWPLIGRHRWRLGEVTVPWASVAPR